MEIPGRHFRHILLFYFRKGKNPAQALRKSCSVYGDECLRGRQCQNWFARFRSGNFEVKDEPRPDRPIVEKVDEILEKIEVDRHISSRDIATELNIDHKSVLNHLHKDGYQNKLDFHGWKREISNGSEVLNVHMNEFYKTLTTIN